MLCSKWRSYVEKLIFLQKCYKELEIKVRKPREIYLWKQSICENIWNVRQGYKHAINYYHTIKAFILHNQRNLLLIIPCSIGRPLSATKQKAFYFILCLQSTTTTTTKISTLLMSDESLDDSRGDSLNNPIAHFTLILRSYPRHPLPTK